MFTDQQYCRKVFTTILEDRLANVFVFVCLNKANVCGQCEQFYQRWSKSTTIVHVSIFDRGEVLTIKQEQLNSWRCQSVIDGPEYDILAERMP